MYYSKYTPPVLPNTLLNNLYNRSISHTTDRREIQNIERYIGYVEDFVKGLQMTGFMNASNSEQILAQIGKINTISSLSQQYRGLFGLTQNNNVFLNPTLQGNGILTGEERTRLYCFHEVGHMVHGMFENDIIAFVESMARKYNLSPKDKQLVQMGFDLVDEATVQETAEILGYAFSKKKRPALRSYKQRIGKTGGFLYGSNDIITNFDFYGELEMPAVMLGKTIRGIGTDERYRQVMGIMCQLAQRSYEPGFIKELIDEYSRDGYEANLVRIMHKMGIIKDASYSLFGMATYPESIQMAATAYQRLNDETAPLTDWRPRIVRTGQSNFGEGR